MFHKYMAERLRGNTPTIEEQLLWAENSIIWDEWEKHQLWLPGNAWSPPDDWHIEMVEKPLSAAVGDITLEGTLDALVRLDGKWWSLQWKTYADDLANLVERVSIGWHESMAYPLIAAENGFAPFAGTILGACHKLPNYRMVLDPETGRKSRREVTDQDRIEGLTFHWLACSQSTVARRIDDFTAYARTIGSNQSRNPDACMGAFGNSRCQFYGVCYGGEDIMGPEYIDLEDRYATE